MSRAAIVKIIFAVMTTASLVAVPRAGAETICDTTSGTPFVGGLVSSVDDTTDGLGLFDVCSIAPAPTVTIEPTATASPNPTPSSSTTQRPPSRGVQGPAAGGVQGPPPGVATTDPRPATVGPPRAETTPPTVPAPSTGTVDPPTQQDRTVFAAAVMPTGVALSVIAIALAAAWLGLVAGRRRGLRAGLCEAGGMLDALEDGIVVCDSDDRALAVNATAAGMLGILIGDARGRPLTDLLRGRTENGRDLIASSVEAGGSKTIDGTLAVGEGIPVRIAVTPVYDGPRRIGRAVVIRDMREQRRLLRMKTEILSNVGHELRTPLTSALGFARLVQTRDLTPARAKAFVGAIVEACEKLERVIDLLIDVATVESGTRPTDLARVTVGRLLGSRMAAWRARAPRHVFELQVGEGVGAIVGNGALLEHAVDELLDNAVKFSPDAGTVTVKAWLETDMVQISVSDQGIGIAPEHLEALFDDFSQVDASPTRSYGGLGLGLALVRRVARAHGGSVAVTSRPGLGATFRMRLPAQAGREAHAQQVQPEFAARPRRQGEVVRA